MAARRRNDMSAISTHVLDAVLGKPACGIVILLEKKTVEGWMSMAESVTDDDGRCGKLVFSDSAAIYRFTFAVEAYFKSLDRISIYPEISITFQADGEHHYHIPLLLSDNSYTTYRGS
jgi:5-hydroxyisourate hydrolase